MSNLNFYGRRILRIKSESNKNLTIFAISGQWVGHHYGDEYGTNHQRSNIICRLNYYFKTLVGSLYIDSISSKILWNVSGTFGDVLAVVGENGFIEKEKIDGELQGLISHLYSKQYIF